MTEEARLGMKVRAREDHRVTELGCMRLQRFGAATAAMPEMALDHRGADGG
jgi:hypothetical protein